jgi:hypothetical protein
MPYIELKYHHICLCVADLHALDEKRCRVPSMIMQFLQIASEGWLLCIAFDLAVTITNPFSSLEKRFVLMFIRFSVHSLTHPFMHSFLFPLQDQSVS